MNIELPATLTGKVSPEAREGIILTTLKDSNSSMDALNLPQFLYTTNVQEQFFAPPTASQGLIGACLTM